MEIGKTQFFRAAANLKKILTEADDSALDLAPVEGEAGEDDIAAEIKELMTQMTDEEKESVEAALEILKKYAEGGAVEPEAVPEEDENADELAEAKGSSSLKPRKPTVKKGGGLAGKSIRGLVKK